MQVTDGNGLFSKDTLRITANAPCDNTNRPEVNAQLLPISSLSKVRVGVAIASAGNEIVFAGGTALNDIQECCGSSRVDIYDIAAQTWSTAELSKARFGIAAVTAGNKIFFAGGESGDGAFDTYYSTRRHISCSH